MRPVLLHNPRCSKSRQARDLLTARGVDFVERRYLDDPLDLDELRALAGKLGQPPRAWVRAKEAKEAGVASDASDADWLAAIARCPKLLQRPILITADAAAVGRPPEAILTLIDR